MKKLSLSLLAAIPLALAGCSQNQQESNNRPLTYANVGLYPIQISSFEPEIIGTTVSKHSIFRYNNKDVLIDQMNDLLRPEMPVRISVQGYIKYRYAQEYFVEPIRDKKTQTELEKKLAENTKRQITFWFSNNY